MLLLPILIPLISGIILIFYTPKNLKAYSYTSVILCAILSITLPFLNVDSLIFGKFPLGVDFMLQLDEISVFFSIIFSVIWLIVLRYSFSYFSHDKNKKCFFAFFIAVLGGLIGVCYAANLITLYMFFEFVTVLSFPLIAHDRTEDSLKACKKYLFYSICGALIGLISIFYFYSLGISTVFTAGGIAELADVASQNDILFFLVLACIGFGCKAGMFPLHGWLKTAHPIAPAPASAILSGISTKIGVIAIIRIAYYIVGADLIVGTFAQKIIISIALLTIFLGSMLAYKEKVLKTRLAYSTVSQISYVIFALFIFNKYAFIGALLQVLFHALAKNLLFLSAGTIIHETGITTVDKLIGIGGQLKTTMILFTIAGLSLVGVPFTGGFVSKWYIAIGALENSDFGVFGVIVIMLSAVLTAGYLLTITMRAFFVERCEMKTKILHPDKPMLSPVLAILIIVFGVYPMPIINFLSALADKLL